MPVNKAYGDTNVLGGNSYYWGVFTTEGILFNFTGVGAPFLSEKTFSVTISDASYIDTAFFLAIPGTDYYDEYARLDSDGSSQFTVTLPAGATTALLTFQGIFCVGYPYSYDYKILNISYGGEISAPYMLQATVTGNGSVSPTTRAFQPGDTLSVSATPDTGENLIKWIVTIGTSTTEEPPNLTWKLSPAPSQHVFVTGVFSTSEERRIYWNYSVETSNCPYTKFINLGYGNVAVHSQAWCIADGGFIANGGKSKIYEDGDSALVSITTNALYIRVKSLVVNGVAQKSPNPGGSTGSTLFLTMDGAKNITAIITDDFPCSQTEKTEEGVTPEPFIPPIIPPTPPEEVDPPIPDIPEEEKRKGCTDKRAFNWDPRAEIDDGSCVLPPRIIDPEWVDPEDPEILLPCLDTNAVNYGQNEVCVYPPIPPWNGPETGEIGFTIEDATTGVELTKVDGVYQATHKQLLRFRGDANTQGPYSWSLGDLTSSREELPTHRYYWGGTYVFYPSLVARALEGNFNFARKSIRVAYSRYDDWDFEVFDAITGRKLTYSDGAYQARNGQLLLFRAWGLTSTEARSWDFGDLATSEFFTPTHAYIVGEATTFTVTLTFGTDSKTHDVSVSAEEGVYRAPNATWPDVDVLSEARGLTLRYCDEMGKWSKEHFVNVETKNPCEILNRLGKYHVRQWEIVMAAAFPHSVVYVEEEVDILDNL